MDEDEIFEFIVDEMKVISKLLLQM